MRPITSKLTLLTMLFSTSTSLMAAKWDNANNPSNFVFVTKKPFNFHLMSLPLEGKLTNTHYVWSDTFWPSNMGSISYRWNAEPEPLIFKYKSPTLAELKKMDLSELERLSPSEKYDIFMSKKDSKGELKYELTERVKKLFSPRDLWWEGLCDGWALASINHPEPMRREVESLDKQIVVPFGSTDVKGLLSFYYAKVQSTGAYGRIGKRCSVMGKVPGEEREQDAVISFPSARDQRLPECADTNAGAFHVAITNMIALQDKGFIAEVDRFNDVWNQPVSEYKSEIINYQDPTNDQKKNGIHKIVRIKTTMIYGDELNLLSEMNDPHIEGGFVSMDPVTGTPAQTFAQKEYEYLVEVDIRGNVIGGEWISETRPDFLWVKEGSKNFAIGKSGFDFSGLNTIYKEVRD